MYATNTLQIQIVSSSGDPVSISGIKLLVAKTSSNDGSKNYEYPYEWDELGRVTIKDSLSIVNPLYSSTFDGASVKLLASENFTNSYTLTLPESSGTTDRLVSRTSTDTLSNKTLTSPVINSGLTLRGAITTGLPGGTISTGTMGQVLTTNGTNVYWQTITTASIAQLTASNGIGISGDGYYDGTLGRNIALDWGYINTQISGSELTLRNKKLEDAQIIGTLIAGNTSGTAGQVLTSTGTGVKWEKPNSNFDFGTFTGIFTDPISYLLDKAGMDLGTLTQPANLSVDLGTI